MWKAALIGPLVSATLQPGIAVAPAWRTVVDRGRALRGGANRHGRVSCSGAARDRRRSLIAPPRRSAGASSRARRLSPRAPHRGSRDVAVAPILRQWWPALIALSWLGVAVIGVVKYLVRLRRAYRTFSAATPVSADVLERAHGLRDAARPMMTVASVTVARSRWHSQDGESSCPDVYFN